MSTTIINILLILVLVIVQAVFVAAELSLVSLRDSQIRQLATRGSRGRLVASLTSNPNRFLSAVQVGVTLSGFLAAAFGADRISGDLTPVLQRIGLGEGVSDVVSLVFVTLVVSYLSIVIGELAAKRLALQRTEGIALMMAPLVEFIAQATRPLIWFLGVSTNVVVKVIGGDPGAGREEVSDEEIRAMVSGSATLGDEERRIVDEVFSAGERGLREVMVPRTEVDFLPGDMPAHKAVRELVRSPHSRYPVTGESADDILGFVHVRDLLDPDVSGRTTRLSDIARPVLSLPDTVRVLRALNQMRRSSSHLAIVLDEYGGTAGIVTMEDLVEELVGEITDEYDVVFHERLGPRGDLLIDGLSTLDEFAEKTGLQLPHGPYDTLAGYFMAQLGQLPAVGDTVTSDMAMRHDDEGAPRAQIELRATELDGRRAARFVVRRLDGGDFYPEVESGRAGGG